MAMANRNVADTSVPTTLPIVLKFSNLDWSAVAVTAIAIESRTTIVEWPREKKKPAATGRFPSCISLRVTLSMAAI